MALLMALAKDLEELIPPTERVADQTRRRVLHEEKVPAADSTLTCDMPERHEQIYGRHPLHVALDGGFASKANLEAAESRHIKNLRFAKGRGLKEEDMRQSSWVYKRLRRFRAWIESCISRLKRSFGFSRCTWKSFESFKSYVWSCIVSANLFTPTGGLNPVT